MYSVYEILDNHMSQDEQDDTLKNFAEYIVSNDDVSIGGLSTDLYISDEGKLGFTSFSNSGILYDIYNGTYFPLCTMNQKQLDW